MKYQGVDTQRKAVIWHLKEYGNLTSLEAIKQYGITRLASIIFNLRDEGFKIESKSENKLNRFGNSMTIANYYLTD